MTTREVNFKEVAPGCISWYRGRDIVMAILGVGTDHSKRSVRVDAFVGKNLFGGWKFIPCWGYVSTSLGFQTAFLGWEEFALGSHQALVMAGVESPDDLLRYLERQESGPQLFGTCARVWTPSLATVRRRISSASSKIRSAAQAFRPEDSYPLPA